MLDYVLLALYLVVVIGIGLRARGRVRGDTEEFLLAGRRLTLPAFVMTIVTTWYGGILGVGEYTYLYGIANWFVFGLPYYLAALIFAVWIAGPAHRTRYTNLPDQLRTAYGPRVARTGAVLVLITTIPAGYVLMLGVLAHTLLGMELWLGVLVGTLMSVGYVYVGGFDSVVRTDRLQFVLMFGGFIVLVLSLWSHFGSPVDIWSRLPASHRSPLGGQGLLAILVWYFIALSTLIEPTFYQRCYAARDERVARRGILLSVACWLVFDLLTTVAGLYAVIAYPELTVAAGAFPQLATDYLPVGLRGIFWVALLAIIMSTIDSLTFVSAVTLGRDIGWRRDAWSGPGQERDVRRALPLVALAAVALAMWFQSIVDLWYVVGTIVTPALLLPVLGSFATRTILSASAARIHLYLVAGVTLAWEIAQRIYSVDTGPGTIPAIFVGFFVSLAIWIVDRMRAPAAGK